MPSTLRFEPMVCFYDRRPISSPEWWGFLSLEQSIVLGRYDLGTFILSTRCSELCIHDINFFFPDFLIPHLNTIFSYWMKVFSVYCCSRLSAESMESDLQVHKLLVILGFRPVRLLCSESNISRLRFVYPTSKLN
jgi:hypothetical protein